MQSKIIFVSIFLTLCFRSSAADPEVRQILCDGDFIGEARASLQGTVAIVVTNATTDALPAFMKEAFQTIVSKFILISIRAGSRKFAKIAKYLRNFHYPSLYVMQEGFLLKRKLAGSIPDNIAKMVKDARNPNAEKRSRRRITEDFQEYLAGNRGQDEDAVEDDPAERTDVASAPVSAAAACEPGVAILGRAKGIDFDLNGSPPPEEEDNSSKKMRLSGGSEVTPSFRCNWGTSYGDAARQSKSPPAPPTGSAGSRRPSKSPTAPTGSAGARGPSKSPSASTGSAGARGLSKSPSTSTGSAGARGPSKSPPASTGSASGRLSKNSPPVASRNR